MSNMSELDIERQEAKRVRAYIANDIRVAREVFIMQLCLALYEEQETNIEFGVTNFREVINEFIKGDSADTLTLDGKIFSSYLEDIAYDVGGPDGDDTACVFTMVGDTPQIYPMKMYTVTYDINVVPLIVAKVRRAQKWKRVSTFIEATSFKEAREVFKAEFKKNNSDRN